MKKGNILILLVVLVISFVFAGCTRAENSSSYECAQNYIAITKNYGLNSETKKYEVFKDLEVDLYADSYKDEESKKIIINNDSYECNDLNTQIIDESSVFSILKYSLNQNTNTGYGEYEAVVYGASQFFNYYKVGDSSIADTADKNEIAKLYNAIENLKNICSDVYDKKKGFDFLCESKIDLNNYTFVQIYKDFLNSYKKLIAGLYDISSIYVDIYTKNYTGYTISKTTMASGEQKRFIRSVVTYLSYYFYQKQMLLNSAYDNMFAHKQIQSGQNNKKYDTTFEKYQSLLNNLDAPDTDDNTKCLQHYNAYQKLDIIKTGIQNYSVAVEKINAYKSANKKDDSTTDENYNVPTTNENYVYVEYVKNFDTEILNYENFILTNVL